jgi:hypothetical protein
MENVWDNLLHSLAGYHVDVSRLLTLYRSHVVANATVSRLWRCYLSHTDSFSLDQTVAMAMNRYRLPSRIVTLTAYRVKFGSRL